MFIASVLVFRWKALRSDARGFFFDEVTLNRCFGGIIETKNYNI